jgi:hypothetical protein
MRICNINEDRNPSIHNSWDGGCLSEMLLVSDIYMCEFVVMGLTSCGVEIDQDMFRIWLTEWLIWCQCQSHLFVMFCLIQIRQNIDRTYPIGVLYTSGIQWDSFTSAFVSKGLLYQHSTFAKYKCKGKTEVMPHWSMQMKDLRHRM